jgi:hypothetical protein
MLKKMEKTILQINQARLGLSNKLYVITNHCEISKKLHLLGDIGIREFRFLPEDVRLSAMVDVCEDKVALSCIKEKKEGVWLYFNSKQHHHRDFEIYA